MASQSPSKKARTSNNKKSSEKGHNSAVFNDSDSDSILVSKVKIDEFSAKFNELLEVNASLQILVKHNLLVKDAICHILAKQIDTAKNLRQEFKKIIQDN